MRVETLWCNTINISQGCSGICRLVHPLFPLPLFVINRGRSEIWNPRISLRLKVSFLFFGEKKKKKMYPIFCNECIYALRPHLFIFCAVFTWNKSIERLVGNFSSKGQKFLRNHVQYDTRLPFQFAPSTILIPHLILHTDNSVIIQM